MIINWGVPIVLGFWYYEVSKDGEGGTLGTVLLIATILFTAGAVFDTYLQFKKAKTLAQNKTNGNRKNDIGNSNKTSTPTN